MLLRIIHRAKLIEFRVVFLFLFQSQGMIKSDLFFFSNKRIHNKRRFP